VAVTSTNEVDEIVALTAAAARRTLVVARRAAEARRQARTRQRATASAAPPAAGHAREDAALAAAWRREATAARWAAADVARDHDPVAAAAWDQRVRDAGIDPDEVRAEAVDEEVGDPGTATAPGEGTTVDAEPATGHGPDPTSAATSAGAGPDAADLVTEHLAETYTDEALDRAGDADPTPTPTVGDLIAATEPVERDLPASAAFSVSALGNDEGVDAALDVGRLEHTRDEGVER